MSTGGEFRYGTAAKNTSEEIEFCSAGTAVWLSDQL